MTLSVSALAGFFGGFETFEFVFIFFGFFINVLIKEVNYKNEYLFYCNNGISKPKLLLYAYLMNLVFSLGLILAVNLIMKFI